MNIEKQLDSILGLLEQTIEGHGADYKAVKEAKSALKKLIIEARVESIKELKRRWDEDRKTMDYSPDTYLYLCDKYLKELKEGKDI